MTQKSLIWGYFTEKEKLTVCFTNSSVKILGILLNFEKQKLSENYLDNLDKTKNFIYYLDKKYQQIIRIPNIYRLDISDFHQKLFSCTTDFKLKYFQTTTF